MDSHGNVGNGPAPGAFDDSSAVRGEASLCFCWSLTHTHWSVVDTHTLVGCWLMGVLGDVTDVGAALVFYRPLPCCGRYVAMCLPCVWAVGFGDKRSGVADEDVLNPNSSSARDAG